MTSGEQSIVNDFHNHYYNGPGADGPIFMHTY